MYSSVYDELQGHQVFTTEGRYTPLLPRMEPEAQPIKNRERFLRSGAGGRLPDVENAPGTQLSAADPKYYAVTWRFEEITPVLKPAR